MLAAAAATLALMGSADDPGYAFARSLALAGPRPAAGAAERTAQARVAAVFRDAGLAVTHDRFAVPGRGRSRNVTSRLRPAAKTCPSTRCRGALRGELTWKRPPRPTMSSESAYRSRRALRRRRTCFTSRRAPRWSA